MLDAVVVGAGLAGLTAARKLARAGLEIEVLEARDRVGGRTWSRPVGNAVFDVGGQWIGPEQQRIGALVHELELETFPTFSTGRKVLDLGDRTRTYKGSIPRLPMLSLLEVQRLIRATDRHAHSLNAERPDTNKHSKEWDGISVADWEDSLGLREDVRAIVSAGLRVVFGVETHELSVLQFFAYVRSAGGLLDLLEIEGAAQETRIADGAQSISRRLAEELSGSVRLNAPVRAISQNGGSLEIMSDDGVTQARFAVVAVPPNIASDIAYTPALPEKKRDFLDGCTMGSTVKALVTYDEAFWRDDGFSGEVVSTHGPLSLVFDNTSADEGQPCLLAFSCAAPAREFGKLTPHERQDLVIGSLSGWFGPQAQHATSYLDCDWGAEAWSGGCPVALPRVAKTASSAEMMRQATGRIHWAGTETAIEWRGYMDGAVESGHRAAQEIIDRAGDS